jgi:non-homologous end joining protein Ku
MVKLVTGWGGTVTSQLCAWTIASQTRIREHHRLRSAAWGHFDPSEFEDRYETAVVEMLKQRQVGVPPRKEAAIAPPATVVNLMDALRREPGLSSSRKYLSPKQRGTIWTNPTS